MYRKGSQVKFSLKFWSLKVVFIIANSVDPDEMQQNAAFHLGLHCLPKYPFRGFQYTRVKECFYAYAFSIKISWAGLFKESYVFFIFSN